MSCERAMSTTDYIIPGQVGLGYVRMLAYGSKQVGSNPLIFFFLLPALTLSSCLNFPER